MKLTIGEMRRIIADAKDHAKTYNIPITSKTEIEVTRCDTGSIGVFIIYEREPKA